MTVAPWSRETGFTDFRFSGFPIPEFSADPRWRIGAAAMPET